MTKHLILSLLFLTLSLNSYADEEEAPYDDTEEIELSNDYPKPSTGIPHIPLPKAHAWISASTHTLQYNGVLASSTMRIISLFDYKTVFELVLPKSGTVTLPSELNGTYKIEFCRNTYNYYGLISL